MFSTGSLTTSSAAAVPAAAGFQTRGGRHVRGATPLDQRLEEVANRFGH